MKKPAIIKIILIPFILVLITIACTRGKIFEKYHKFENNTWKRVGDNVWFEVPVKDTTTLYDLFIAIRHATFYPYDKISVGITIYAPSGEMRYSEHNILLKDGSGKFIAEGLGDIWDIKIPFKEKFSFSNRGIYKFEIENLTGTKYLLPGVMEVGLVIRKAAKK